MNTMGTLRYICSVCSVAGIVTAALAGGPAELSTAWAAEFHFAAQDLGENRAVWLPGEVVIHKSTELQDGLVFVLENPTNSTHAFAAYGLFEEITGARGEISTKPLRVNVTPDDSVRIQVSTAQFEAILGGSGPKEEYPFFCPLHKGDAHLGGTIRVVE